MTHLYTRGTLKKTLFDRPGANLDHDPQALLGVQVSKHYWDHLPQARQHDALMDEIHDNWEDIEEVRMATMLACSRPFHGVWNIWLCRRCSLVLFPRAASAKELRRTAHPVPSVAQFVDREGRMLPPRLPDGATPEDQHAFDDLMTRYELWLRNHGPDVVAQDTAALWPV